MIITLNPLSGTDVVKFGMPLNNVVSTLKNITGQVTVGKRKTNHVYAFGSSLQIEFDQSDLVQYIGVGFYPGCGAEFKIFDVNPFDKSSTELFEIISSHSNGFHEYSPVEYLWDDIIATVWDADSQYDYLGGEIKNIYGSVGVGNLTYLAAIREIKSKFRI